MTRKRAILVRTALTLTLGAACESPASRDGVDVPRQPASQIETGPAPEARLEPIQPQPDKPLVDRVYDLATRFGQGLTTESIEASLDVHLTGTGPVFSGTSKRWPIVVSFVPAKGDEDASLGISFSDVTTLTLGDVEGRFGPPIRRIEAKESRSVFNTPSGAQLRVTLLGGVGPKALVGTMRLEAIPKKKPHLPDLFDGSG